MAALRVDDAILDLIAHVEAVPVANGIGVEQQPHRVGVSHAVQCDGPASKRTHTVSGRTSTSGRQNATPMIG